MRRLSAHSAAVSVRRMRFPRLRHSIPAALASAISSSEKPPSGPMKTAIFRRLSGVFFCPRSCFWWTGGLFPWFSETQEELPRPLRPPRIFIGDQAEGEVRKQRERVLPAHREHDLRDDRALGLLRGGLCDRLPALPLCGSLPRAQTDDRVPAFKRDDPPHAELHRLLEDELHLVGFREPLKEPDVRRELMDLLPKADPEKDFLLPELCHLTLVIRPLPVGDENPLSGTRSQHILQMP